MSDIRHPTGLEPRDGVARHRKRPNLSGVSFRDLELVVAVADHGSFIRAAGHCHVSQPTISVQVRQVEARLNVVIFRRAGRGIVMTREGASLVDQMRRTLREAAALFAMADESGEPFSGLLCLAAEQSLAPYLFPRLIGPVRTLFPDLSLQLGEALRTNLFASLSSGSIEAALVTQLPATHSFHERLVGHEKLWMACPELTTSTPQGMPPWRELPPDKRIILAELTPPGLSDLPGAANTRQALIVESALYRVASGEGCALIPALAARDYPGVVFHDPGLGLERPIHLLWHGNTRDASSFEQLATAIATVIP